LRGLIQMDPIATDFVLTFLDSLGRLQ
jgi:hypothetical protein